MPHKILIAYPIGEEKLQALDSAGYEIHQLANLEQRYEQILSVIHEYDGVLTFLTPIDKQIMDKGDKLKVIANYGVGYDNIDVAYAQRKGIAVTNTPLATSISTANFTMGLLLALLRKIVVCDRWLRQGDVLPFWGHNMVLGEPIGGKTLGIIGMGRIGKAVAKRARAFDMTILYHNRNRLSEEMELEHGCRYVSMDELLSQSDIVSIHTPLTESTKGLLDATAFAQMKKGAYFINTARGGVIDTEALINALTTNHLAGAALDVFEKEPHIPEALLTMDQVILAPHNGTATRAARDAMFAEAFGNITAFLSGKEMTSRIV